MTTAKLENGRLQGISKGTDSSAVSPILLARLRSASYKVARSDRTLTGATLEVGILSQGGDSTLRDFKPSRMNHGEESVVRQMIPVKRSRLTVSDTVTIDEPAGGYIEMMEFRNSARVHLIALLGKGALRYYLEGIITTIKQKAYEMHTEPVDQLLHTEPEGMHTEPEGNAHRASGSAFEFTV